MKTNTTKNRRRRILRLYYTSRGLTQGVATLSSVGLWRKVRQSGSKGTVPKRRKKRLGTKPELPNYDILVWLLQLLLKFCELSFVLKSLPMLVHIRAVMQSCLKSFPHKETLNDQVHYSLTRIIPTPPHNILCI